MMNSQRSNFRTIVLADEHRIDGTILYSRLVDSYGYENIIKEILLAAHSSI